MLQITRRITVPYREIEWHAVCAQGAGGQNVNKVATAIHLRFDIRESSLPDRYKQRLLQLSDSRITKEGVIVIKAQQYRTQKQNREMALLRLQELIANAVRTRKKRIATVPTPASIKKRRESKIKRGRLKAMRKKVTIQD